MIQFEKPRIEIQNLNEEGTYGEFIVEPLERGYGIIGKLSSSYHALCCRAPQSAK